MKTSKWVIIGLLLILVVLPALTQETDEIPFHVQRLSDRVLTLTEISPMENIIVAIATEKGLVVVESSGSPVTAALAKKCIAKEFGRRDFTYLINTHHHWDHAWGNQVFSDAVIVGHQDCVSLILDDDATATRMVSRTKDIIKDLKARIKNLGPNHVETEALRRQLASSERIVQGLSKGFIPTPPHIGFNDHMTLHLGDITIKLIYFGRAHSSTDILIQIPEEELLLTGDLFLDIGWLPLFAGQPELDIPRWIDVLSIVLDGEDKVTRVIPGHRKIWTREKFDLWRVYIVNLWEGVNTAKAEGLNLQQVLTRFPLEDKYLYLKELGHTDAALEQFQRRNVEAFWRQLFQSAASMVEETLMESGIEAAKEAFWALNAKASSEVLFNESDFNALGYRLMGNSQIQEAIEIFKLNVEAFPDSWNGYDSLGEAYMNDGQIALAIKAYEKSIQLNPENENGKQMLERLGKRQ